MDDNGSLSELLLGQSPACHWVVSADGIFQNVYGDTTAVFGRPASEVTGQSIFQLLSKNAAAVWMTRFARAFSGETVTLRERCGDAIWHMTVFPIRVNTTIGYAGGLGRNATAWNTGEQELRRTVLGALKAQEFERSMVAKFLHDTIGQNLTALGLQLDLVRMDLEDVSPDTSGQIAELQRFLGGIMEKVREYSHELNPSAVERSGLRPALDRFTQSMRDRFPGSLRVNVDPSVKLNPDRSRALFQIAQEAVKNSVQHSGCSIIEISLKSTRTGTILEVRDNGRGFDPGDTMKGGRGLGLLSMEHYAAQAGLELDISSNPKTGTLVRAAAQDGA